MPLQSRRNSVPSAVALVLLLTVLTAAVSCGQVAGQGPFRPSYEGIQTVLLDGDLVNFHVSMRGARNRADVDSYGRCAAAQYALIRGYGFARHVRTTVDRAGGVWHGDAVYVVSASLPLGFRNLDAEVVVRDCGELGIPTV